MEVQRFNQSFEELVTLLDNSAGMEFCYVVAALGELNDRRAIEPLLKNFTRYMSRFARREITRVLTEFNDVSTIVPLWEIVKNSEHAGITRRFATYPLASINDDSRALLFEGLHHPDSGVRCAVMWGLSKIGSDCAIEALAKALETETILEVREAALTALGKSKHPQAIESILSVLENKNDLARQNAISALGYTERPEVIPILEKILYQDTNREMRAEAANVIGWPEFQQTTQILLKGLLEDSYSKVRYECIYALWRYHTDKPIVAELLFALHDPVAEIRAKVADTLGEISNLQAIQPLLGIAQDEAEKIVVRESAIAALGEFKENAATISNYLLSLLLHKKGRIRAAAADALGDLKESSAFEALLKVLNDRFPSARQSAIAALKKIGHPDTASVFLQRLKLERKAFTRNNLVEALGELRNKSAVEPLLKELTRNRVYKGHVLHSLGNLGDTRVCDALANFTQDEDKYTRLAAIGGLAKLNDRRGFDLLIYLLRDYSHATRYWAIQRISALGAKAIEALPTLDWLSQHDRCEKLLGKEKITIRQAAANTMEKIIASLAE